MSSEELIVAELAYWAKQYRSIDPTTKTRFLPHSTNSYKVTQDEVGQIWGKMCGLAYSLDLIRNGERDFVRHSGGEWWQIMQQALTEQDCPK